MAEDKISFLLYSDQQELIEELTDKEAGKLIKHIFRYVNDENPITDDPIIKIAFIPIKRQLKRDLTKWDKIRTTRSDNGILGNLKRWNTELYDDVVKGKITLEKANSIVNNRKVSPSDNSIANVAVNDNVNVNVNVIKDKYIYPSFSDFWNLYDKKVDLKKSELKWNKLNQPTKLKIMDYIPDYKISQPNKEFRKYPMTFFNNESWNNELIINNKENEKNSKSEMYRIAIEIAEEQNK